MNLNRISVGGGLAVLGCSIFALAGAMVVSSGGNPAQAGSPMFAGDRKGEAVPPMPSMVEGEPLRGVEGGAGMAAMGGASCVEVGEPMDWFGSVRELTECQYIRFRLWGAIAGTPVNVDGTGVDEAFEVQPALYNPIAVNGVPASNGCVYALRRCETDGTGQVFATLQCVLDSTPIAEFAVSRLPGAASISFSELAWADLDGDDDFDLLGYVSGEGEGGGFAYFWLENTGYEHSQGLVGDLDGSGSVNATDLAMLLSGWTGG